MRESSSTSGPMRIAQRISAGLAAMAVFVAATPTGGEPHGPADPPSRDLTVHCGTLHVGNGQVMRNVWMVVRDGAVASIHRDRPDAGLPVVDASDKVVFPGLVAADTDLSQQRDVAYNVTPDFVAADGFDFDRKWVDPLSGGVTTAYLSPGRERLVSGQGSVVKLAGRDILRRALAERSCLRVAMGAEALAGIWVFEPTPHPTSDDPLLPARRQVPTSRISLLTELRRLFAESANADGPQGAETMAAEDLYDPSALADVVAGSLPLRISAREGADLRRAIRFSREMGVRPLLEDPWQFDRVADEAAEAQAACVFRMPWAPGRSIGSDNRNPRIVRPDPTAPAVAEAHGVPFALTAYDNSALSDFLMVPALAVRSGVSPKAALSAVTLGAAKILGIDERVGSLEPGKDADFIILSGEPLAIGTMVEQTWVDGERAWTRQTGSSILAVRTSRVLSGDGTTWRDGVVIADGTVIKDVGEELSVPYGAEVIEIEGGVMVPGFVDAYSHLGMAGRTGGPPQGSPNQRIGDALSPTDPLLRSAVEAGLTTVLVSGPDGNTANQARPAGRVAAIKTAASDRDRMVLRDIAGIRFVMDSIAPDGINAIKGAIDRAKKYVEAWEKYDKALADWKAGKGEKPKQVIAPKETAKEDPISGTWEVELQDAPIPFQFVLNLTLEGTNITGSISMSFRGRPGRDLELQSGSLDGSQFTLVFGGPGGEATMTGTASGDSCSGEVTLGQLGTFGFSGTRTSKAPGAAPTKSASSGSDDGSPTKPSVDENLEPMAALLRGEVPAVIRADRAPAIRAVMGYFTEAKLDFVLHGMDDALEDPSILGDARPPVLLDPGFVRRKGREVTNHAAAAADHGLPVALVSAAGEGGKNLPLHAAYAVRYGMSPMDALAAVTSQPAKMFGIDDRVGSLAKGKDADFVVFSGDPFEPTSRIVLVVVDGKVVVDNRENN